MRKYLILSIGVLAAQLFAGPFALAAQVNYDAAQSGNAALDIGVGGRAPAMAGASGSVTDDITSLHWNPAGLNRLRAPQIMLMHNLWLENTSQEYGAFGLPLGDGAVALAVAYLNYGALQGWDEYGQATGTFAAYDLNVTLGYGHRFSERFAGGLAVKLPISVIADLTQLSVALDAGAQYQVPTFQPLHLGLVVKNLGSATGNGQSPSQIVLSAGLVQWLEQETVVLDVGKRLSEDTLFMKLGFEYALWEMLYPRLGVRLSTDPNGLGDALSGLTMGLGYQQPLGDWTLRLDYAFVPYGLAGSSHRLALMVEVGPPSPYSSMVKIQPEQATRPESKQVSRQPGAVRTPVPVKVKSSQSTLQPPRKVSVRGKGPRLYVTWQSSVSPDRHGYHVYLRRGTKGVFKKINTKLLRKNSFTSRKYSRRRTYYVMVKTVDKQGRKSRGSTPRKIYLR